MHLGVRDEGKAFFRALEKSIALPVLHTAAAGVDLTPSGLHSPRQGTDSSERWSRPPEPLSTRTPGDWEVVIIDCPPSWEFLLQVRFERVGT